MAHEPPQIVKLAERVLVEMEVAVRGFPRYHKYAIGADLRESTKTVARYAHRAWRDQKHRGEWINRLVFAIDDLKLSMQVAKRVEAFSGGFKQFEALIRIISDLGRQCGGWHKAHFKGQNDQTDSSDRRAQILSTPGTPQGVNL